MASISSILKKQEKLFLKAKDDLETTQKTSQKLTVSVDLKVKTYKRVLERIDNLDKAKKEAVKNFDAKIKNHTAEAVRLKKEIEKETEQLPATKKKATTKAIKGGRGVLSRKK